MNWNVTNISNANKIKVKTVTRELQNYNFDWTRPQTGVNRNRHWQKLHLSDSSSLQHHHLFRLARTKYDVNNKSKHEKESDSKLECYRLNSNKYWWKVCRPVGHQLSPVTVHLHLEAILYLQWENTKSFQRRSDRRCCRQCHQEQ